MKVYIGPYKTWWGPYQIADLLQKVGISEERCDKIGEWLAETWLMDFCNWVESKKKRKIKIKIDYYDVWSMDHTLSLIILPMLKLLKEKKHGSPCVDDSDVPEELRSYNAPPIDKNMGEVDELFHKRWEWVLDQMIWSFEHKVKDENEYNIEIEKRIAKGIELFGKYYGGLWD